MLSDSCYEFTFAFDSAAQILLKAVEWYCKPDHPVQYGAETYPLRRACARYRVNPEDNKARINLLRAAVLVMEHLDCEPVFGPVAGSDKMQLVSGRWRTRSEK